MFYPLFLSLKDLECLIIGFGKVGKRKLKSILPCKPAKVLILDICDSAQQDFLKLHSDVNISFELRRCTREDVKRYSLIYAATNDPTENLRVAQLCKLEKKLCNSATNPDTGNFIVPVTVNRGLLSCALSTAGASPMLAKYWKKDLDEWLTEKEQMINLMNALRPYVINNHQIEHQAIFEELCSAPLEEWLLPGKQCECLNWIKQILPDIPLDTLQNIISECIYAGSK